MSTLVGAVTPPYGEPRHHHHHQLDRSIDRSLVYQLDQLPLALAAVAGGLLILFLIFPLLAFPAATAADSLPSGVRPSSLLQ